MSVQATLIGATGLIGGHLLRLLQSDPYFYNTRVLVRRSFETDSPRTEVRVVDFGDVNAYRSALEGTDLIFVAVGTTQKKVGGDMAAYRKVDFDIPVHAAQLGKDAGARHLLLVSSVGADPASRNFYLKLKGETEAAITKTGIAAASFFRPSMLLGNRQESRPGERVGQVAMQVFSRLLVGGWRKYKPIQAETVAAAMVAQAKHSISGSNILEYDAMIEKERRLL